jgi:WD40 repeat protein
VIVAHDDLNGTWELYQNDLQRKIAEYSGHSQGILNAACNPRGDMVATISSDRTLRLWELSQGPAQSPRTANTPTISPMNRSALVR